MKPSVALQMVKARWFKVDGICMIYYNIQTENFSIDSSEDWYLSLYEQMRRHGIHYSDWPHWSGDETFPVPDPHGKYKPHTMYSRTVFKWCGEYGKLRKDLLDWLISEFKKRGL